jgi:hypothetical protein
MVLGASVLNRSSDFVSVLVDLLYYILKNSTLNDGISSGFGWVFAPPPPLRCLVFFLLKLALKNFNA